MNGVSNYGTAINSQVNFQGKVKPYDKQCERLFNGLKKRKAEDQKTTQKSINTISEIFNEFQNGKITKKEVNTISELFNEFQNGKITEKEVINKLTKMLEQIEGKSKGLNVMG